MYHERYAATRQRQKASGRLAALSVLFLILLGGTGRVWAAYDVIRQGSRGPDVVIAQHILYQLGYLDQTPDGIFGPSTLDAVRRFQRQQKLTADGVVGEETWRSLRRALDERTTRIHVVQPNETIWALARRYGIPQQRLIEANGIKDPSLIRVGRELVIPTAAGPAGREGVTVELLSWDEAKEIYANFVVATVTDVLTGKTFRVRRYYGTYHADSEPLTARDTATLREIYTTWSWDRRPIIVEVGGRRIAASMNGMPHGQGSIEENGFPGHFCIHFLGSRIHQSGRMDVEHHKAILRAVGYRVSDLWLTR